MSINKIAILTICFLLISFLSFTSFLAIRSNFPDSFYKADTLILVEQVKVEKPAIGTEKLSLVVKKSARKMHLYEGQKLRKTYNIALGFNPTGTKLKQGDGATPEGEYFLTHKNAKSKFYLSLGVSFPNKQDAEAGLRNKLISQMEYEQILAAQNNQQKPPQNTKLGGDIFLHGGGTNSDWTWGCVALSNEDIKELFDLLPIKTPIKIDP